MNNQGAHDLVSGTSMNNQGTHDLVSEYRALGPKGLEPNYYSILLF